MLLAMLSTRKTTFLNWLNTIALWLGLGFSLGWYYTFTYYGRSGWPMPSVESCGSLIMYYFSVINAATPIQAAHWMAVFPLAGILWAGLLALTAPRFGGQTECFSRTALRLALASLPLTLPGFYLAYLAGGARGAWSIHVMMDVALRRGGVTPPPWISPVYLVLGLTAFGCQVFVYRIAFGIRGKNAWLHYLITAALYVLTVVGLAVLAAIPLRHFLE